MEIKLGVLINSQEVLENMIGAFETGDFKISVVWRLKETIKEIESYITKFHDFRNTLIQKYGTEVDGVVSVNPEGEDFEKFVEELNELADEDVVLEKTKKIKLSDIAEYKIKYSDSIKVDWLIENDII